MLFADSALFVSRAQSAGSPSSPSVQFAWRLHLFDFSLLIPNKRSPGWVGIRTPIME